MTNATPRPTASQVETALACLEIAAGAPIATISRDTYDVIHGALAAPARVYELVAGEYADRVTVGIYTTREAAEREILRAVLDGDRHSPVRDHEHVEIVEHVVERTS